MTRKSPVEKFDPLSRLYVERHGRFCALVRMTAGQCWGYGVALLALVAEFLLWPQRTWVLFSYCLAFFFFFVLAVRLAAILISVVRQPALKVSAEELAALPEEDLPIYSVLVPLFREPEVVPALFAALRSLDYPAHKLDIQLLVEPHDTATITALQQCGLADNMRITEAPHGFPQTKPRACNAGLENARGELLVIFDAEDRPEPDQLKKAVAAYRKMPPEVVCLQARLDHYNSMQSLFSQWAAMEYLIWYRWILPGLQVLGAPIPLGGTSNHFRTNALRQLGGWDPFNVTEDCDLGMRIARRGWQTRMLDSVTWEEAVTIPSAWIRQRTRWIKGYWQTWLVQSRSGALREFGFWKWLLFAATVGGSTAMLVLNPIMWAILAAWFFVGWPMADFQDPFSVAALGLTVLLMALNLVFIGINIAGCILSRRSELVPVALLSPVEWVLLGLAAWRGMFQFFVRPFHWEKTPHGRAVHDVALRLIRLRLIAPVGSLALAVAVVSGLIWLVVARIETEVATRPRQLPATFVPPAYPEAETICGFDAPDRSDRQRGPVIESSQIAAVTTNMVYQGQGALMLEARFPGVVEVRLKPGTDWLAYAALRWRMFLPQRVPRGARVLVYLRDRDGLWYEHFSPQMLLPGVWTRFEVPLHATSSHAGELSATNRWQPRGHGRPWDEYTRQKVSVLGFRVYGHGPYTGPVYLDQIEGIKPAGKQRGLAPPTIWRILPATNAVPQWGRYEIVFQLDRAYSNPFDPEVVDVMGCFVAPSGREIRVPAFFYQGFTRSSQEGTEVLVPEGPSEWRIRFTPMERGLYRWRIRVRDYTGAQVESPDSSFEATEPRDERGFVRLSRRARGYLEYDNGQFYYPIGHNVCVPRDPLQAYPYPFTVPEGEGTFFYDRVFARMAENGENWTRIWMTSWWVGLEGRPDWPWFHGVGRYNMANAWRLDHLVELAERHDIAIQLTLHHYSEFSPGKSWFGNAYNAVCGGPLRRPQEFFNNPAARKAFRNRLRYIVARWGYSPHILAWELWGEVNLAPYDSFYDVGRWHEEMARYLKQTDPWQHPVFTHCHNWRHGDLLWALPEIECIQGNGYIRPPNDTPDHVLNFRRYFEEVQRYGKPVFVAEYGGRSELGAPSRDYLEAQLHSGLWASLVSPLAGAAMHWWWNFIEGENLYFHYRAVAEFARGIDRIRERFDPADPTVIRAPAGVSTVGLRSENLHIYWVYHRNVFTTLKDCPLVEGTELRIRGIAPGWYDVMCWDTMRGESVRQERLNSTPASRGLAVSLPPFRGDIAVKLQRVTDQD